MKVEVEVPEHSLPRNGEVKLHLRQPSGKLIGCLNIGRTKVTWRKSHARTTREMSLENLIEVLDRQTEDDA